MYLICKLNHIILIKIKFNSTIIYVYNHRIFIGICMKSEYIGMHVKRSKFTPGFSSSVYTFYQKEDISDGIPEFHQFGSMLHNVSYVA